MRSKITNSFNQRRKNRKQTFKNPPAPWASGRAEEPSLPFYTIIPLPSSGLFPLPCGPEFHSPIFLFLWPRKVEYRREGWGSEVAISDGWGGRRICAESFSRPGLCHSGSFGCPRPPRIEPRAPRSEPRAPKSDPRPPQDPPGTTQDRPRAAQDTPRPAQELPVE